MDFPQLTGGVDVKVGGLIGHVSHGVQTRPPGMHLAGVTHIFSNIDSVGTLVDVLTSKQHFHLRREKEESVKASLMGEQCLCFVFFCCSIFHRNLYYLVNTFNFWEICDCVSSAFIFVGLDLSLGNKTRAVR